MICGKKSTIKRIFSGILWVLARLFKRLSGINEEALYLCIRANNNGGYGVAVARELVELSVWVQLPVATPK